MKEKSKWRLSISVIGLICPTSPCPDLGLGATSVDKLEALMQLMLCVLASSCCYDKALQIGWLTKTHIYSYSSGGKESKINIARLSSGVSGLIPSGGSREELVSYLFSFRGCLHFLT
jgi:hypothetical protein